MSQSIDNALNSEVKDLFRSFAIPGMIGMLIVSLYNFVDSIYVGQFIGPEAVAAVSIVYPIVIVNQAIALLFGSGSMALLSRSIGAQDSATRNKIFGTLFLSVVAFSLIFSIFTFFFSKQILFFLGAKEEVFFLGNTYLKILSVGLVFGAVGPAVNMLLRGEGKMKEAMLIMTIGTVLNILLDPILIYYFKMGIAGAAVATVLSQIVIFMMSLSFALTQNSEVHVSLRHFRIYSELLPEIIRIGIGPMIMLFMVVIHQTFLFKTISNLGGSDQLALIGATYRVYYFAFVPLWGISQGLLPLIGMNYGAQKLERVWTIFFSFTLKATLIAIVIWLSLMIFGKTILSWFINDYHLVATGTSLFKVLNCTIFTAGLLNTPVVMFQAIGKARQPLVILIGRQIFFFIPLLLILPHFFGIIGVWMSIPASDFCIAMIALALVVYEKKKMLAGALLTLTPTSSEKQAPAGEITLRKNEEKYPSHMIANEKIQIQTANIQRLHTDSEQNLIKATLTEQIRKLLKDQGVNQAEAVELLNITHAQAATLMSCCSAPFSLGRLMELLATLGQDVEVTIKPSSRPKNNGHHGRLSVNLQPA